MPSSFATFRVKNNADRVALSPAGCLSFSTVRRTRGQRLGRVCMCPKVGSTSSAQMNECSVTATCQLSSENLADHMAADVGQLVIAALIAVSQAVVVDT